MPVMTNIAVLSHRAVPFLPKTPLRLHQKCCAQMCEVCAEHENDIYLVVRPLQLAIGNVVDRQHLAYFT